MIYHKICLIFCHITIKFPPRWHHLKHPTFGCQRNSPCHELSVIAGEVLLEVTCWPFHGPWDKPWPPKNLHLLEVFMVNHQVTPGGQGPFFLIFPWVVGIKNGYIVYF